MTPPRCCSPPTKQSCWTTSSYWTNYKPQRLWSSRQTAATTLRPLIAANLFLGKTTPVPIFNLPTPSQSRSQRHPAAPLQVELLERLFRRQTGSSTDGSNELDQLSFFHRPDLGGVVHSSTGVPNLRPSQSPGLTLVCPTDTPDRLSRLPCSYSPRPAPTKRQLSFISCWNPAS